MPHSAHTPGADSRELVLTRLIDAPRDKLFRCWTEPALIVQWFTPPPWKTIHAETDVRPGGSSFIVMKGPDGTEMPNRGVYLDVVKNERIVGAFGQTVLHLRAYVRGRRRQDSLYRAGPALDGGGLRNA